MKKVSLLGFILAATTAQLVSADVAVSDGAVAVAQPQPGCPKAFQGFHLGGNIGYAVGTAKRSFYDESTDRGISGRAGFRGVDGGIGVGYTHRLCNWALGIAFDANWANTKGNNGTRFDTDTIGKNTRMRNSLDLYARLGYVMREIAMPFIGLGWENAQWRTNASTLVIDPVSLEAFTDSGSKRKRLNAFLWKAGVDFLATKHVVVGFEYTGTYGGKHNLTSRDGTFTTRFKPQNNKFALTAKIVY